MAQGSLWVEHFVMAELSQIMRQKGDTTFSELLCHVRTNSCTADDVTLLTSWELVTDAEDYPTQALLTNVKSTNSTKSHDSIAVHQPYVTQ